ncbi:phospholipase [Dyella halodurans]|uniref:Alkaline phosphatase family protein n=1 Tax=Dyella halodurans TaxID=1920171 RepID=A0ABV9C2I6_9GAMM|nr:alkaline phosphatase family protein [Dyella halodurans]
MPVKHVFVLMLENRSFDHILGYLPGVDGVTPDMSNPNRPGCTPDPVPVSNRAMDRPAVDPAHEFENVWQQLYSVAPGVGASGISSAPPNMQGFVQSQGDGGAMVMDCFADGGAPILQQLASSFVVFNRWFSSMPGPTWPNRFFVHAGSSGGLTNSPSGLTSLSGVTMSSAAFEFQNGSIYDLLDTHKVPWRVYHGDDMPQVLAVGRHVMPFIAGSSNFVSIRPGDSNDPFAAELNSGNYDVGYAFIEPDYNLASNMFFGNSQHPRSRLSSGEALIKYVYETIRNSPVWEDSLLVVTYDEHGGFFDHVAPVQCTAPGDQDLNSSRAENPYSFDFQRYGVRVPAVLVSPWVDPAVENAVCDHTSILRTVCALFGLPSLTARDANATSLMPLLTRNVSRGDDAPKTLNAIGEATDTAAPVPPDVNDTPDPALAGFTRIAASIDIGLRHASAPPAASHALAQVVLPDISVKTVGESLDYINQVTTRLKQHRSRILVK